jgi:ubiquinone/menaquinone biosynthesis C-methylase UbiE
VLSSRARCASWTGIFLRPAKSATSGQVLARYAIELAQRGYGVSLLDVASQLLDKARHAFGVAGLTADAFIEGNARDLSGFPGDSFDAALLLGPLYHIADAAGRLQVLAELKRILKPGGVAIAAYLNTWGLIRTGIADFPNWYRQADTIRSLLSAPSYSTNDLAGFTAAYWSTPTDALREIVTVGFEVITYAGAEGFCGGMWPMVAALAERDPEAYKNVVAVAAETCELPQYRDATDHLHVVIRRPNPATRRQPPLRVG